MFARSERDELRSTQRSSGLKIHRLRNLTILKTERTCFSSISKNLSRKFFVGNCEIIRVIKSHKIDKNITLKVDWPTLKAEVMASTTDSVQHPEQMEIDDDEGASESSSTNKGSGPSTKPSTSEGSEPSTEPSTSKGPGASTGATSALDDSDDESDSVSESGDANDNISATNVPRDDESSTSSAGQDDGAVPARPVITETIPIGRCPLRVGDDVIVKSPGWPLYPAKVAQAAQKSDDTVHVVSMVDGKPKYEEYHRNKMFVYSFYVLNNQNKGGIKINRWNVMRRALKTAPQ